MKRTRVLELRRQPQVPYQEGASAKEFIFADRIGVCTSLKGALTSMLAFFFFFVLAGRPLCPAPRGSGMRGLAAGATHAWRFFQDRGN